MIKTFGRSKLISSDRIALILYIFAVLSASMHSPFHHQHGLAHSVDSGQIASICQEDHVYEHVTEDDHECLICQFNQYAKTSLVQSSFLDAFYEIESIISPGDCFFLLDATNNFSPRAPPLGLSC